MEDVLLVIVVIIVTVAVVGVLLLVLSAIKNRTPSGGQTEIAADASVEYEWSARSKIFGKVVLLLAVLIAGAFFFVYFSEEGKDLLIRLSQIGLFIIGIILSIFASAMKTFTYQITTTGLYRFDAKKGGEKTLIFTWENLSWIKPENDGFRYYLKSPSAGNVSAFGITSGRIYCGDNAMVVNAILMSRGVPIAPPGQSAE